MLNNPNMADRYPMPADGRKPEQRSKATGGGPSPLDPMGAKVPGWSADGGQTPGNSPAADGDYGTNAQNAPKGKKLPGQG